MMKKYFAPVALILGLTLGLAFAQNITKSIQLSQDPSGPIGFDSSNNSYFPKHINATGPSPAVGTCGTSPSVAGSDNAGKITTGSTATTACTLTFQTAFNTAPACVMATAVTNAGPTFVATTTTTATFNYASATSIVFSYVCMSVS